MADSFFVRPGEGRKRARPGQNAGGRSGGAPSWPRGGAKPARGTNAALRSSSRGDEDITSDSEADEANSGAETPESATDSEEDEESVVDKRRRLAKEYLSSLETELVSGFDAKDLDEDIIARRLTHDVAEQQGQIFRDLSTAKVSDLRKLRVSERHLTSVAAAQQGAAKSDNAAPAAVPGANTVSDSTFIYVGSKDGHLSKFRLTPDGQSKPQFIRRRHVGSAVLCVAVDSENRIVVTGGARGFRVWHADSFEMLREFKMKTAVTAACFRRHTRELYVGAADLRLRTYDLAQFAYVETLHGHQDAIVGLSALNQERCVSVGSRDRTAIFWKIPEESRLTFRGGDTRLASRVAAQLARTGPLTRSGKALKDLALDTEKPEAASTNKSAAPSAEEGDNNIDVYGMTLEGSIDCCAMLDHSLFVTGSDNGNAALWSTSRKKPQHVVPAAHGTPPALLPSQASAELDPSAPVEIPPAQPRGVTAIAAVPFSNAFFTGSWSGEIKMWALSEDRRSFTLVRSFAVGTAVVTSLAAIEAGADTFVVVATLSREPRLGRWLVQRGHDTVVTFTVST